MSYTLTISDELHQNLSETAHTYGLSSIQELLEQWQAQEKIKRQRESTVSTIDELRERLFTKYGEMPDSVMLIREDRDR